MAAVAPLSATPAHDLGNLHKTINTTTPTTSKPSTAAETTSSSIPRGPVTAELSFYVPPADGSAPFNYVEKAPEGQPQNNYGTATHDVVISDLRGQESKYSLDNNSFQVLSNLPPSAEKDFTDDEQIKQLYYPEIETLLLSNLPGAHRIFIFDHTIRRSGPNATRTPVNRVHIDQTRKAATARVRHHLGDDAEALLRGRYRIVNVWRPLNGPIVASPLAFADGSSVAEDDLVGVEHRYPDRTGETAGVKYNPGQKWYYLSGMRNDERLLLKCSDSDEVVGPHGRVPHTAFTDSRTPEGAPGRESIEVRALVFG